MYTNKAIAEAKAITGPQHYNNIGGKDRMKTVKVGLLGLGNIGTGTYKTLEMNKAQIEEAAGCKVEITKILERDTTRE